MSGADPSSARDRFERTLDRVSDAVVALDSEFRYTYLNERVEGLLGHSDDELLGTLAWDTLCDLCGTAGRERIETAAATGEETSYKRHDETADQWFEVRVVPDEAGVSVIVADSTDEGRGADEERPYRRDVESLPVAVAEHELSPDGRITYLNDAFRALFDVPSGDEATGRPVESFYADPGTHAAVVEQLRADGFVADREVRFETADGEPFWGSVTAAVETTDGSDTCLLVAQDVSERVEYKRKLSKVRDTTREMLSATTVESVAEMMTRTADDHLGYELNGVHLYDDAVGGLAPVHVSDSSQKMMGEVPVLDEGIAWRAFETGELRVYNDLTEAEELYNEDTGFRSELAAPIGDRGVFIASASETDAFRDDDIDLIKILANNAEAVLTQIEAEQQLRERERELERSRDFLDQTAQVASLGGWEYDVETESVEWTEEVYRIHGFAPGDPLSPETVLSVYYPDDEARIRDAWGELMSTGEPFDLELRVDRDDDEGWVRAIGVPEHEDGRIVAVRGVFQDITEQKERENELYQYRQAIEASEDLVVGVGTDGRYAFANSTYEEYYDCEGVAGRRIREVVGDEEFASTVEPHVQRALDGEPVTYEREREFPDKGTRTLEVRYTPVHRDETDLGFVGILRDVTDRKVYERELEDQRDDLRIINQMMRHDIRNKLQLISAATERLHARTAADSTEYVESILDTVDEATAIIETAKDIIEIMIRSGTDYGSVDLRYVLNDELQSLRSNYPEARVTVDGSLPNVQVAGSDMLGSVFRNVLQNAVQHNDKETAEIDVAVERRDEYATVTVADNGPGIPDDQKDGIFAEGSIGGESGGTGLGLYLVEELVDRYDGRIEVRDNEPEGTRFVLELPIVSS